VWSFGFEHFVCFWSSSKLPRFKSANLPEINSLSESKPWELRLKLQDFGRFPASFRLEKPISTVNLDTFDQNEPQKPYFEHFGCLAPDMARMRLRRFILSILVAWCSILAAVWPE